MSALKLISLNIERSKHLDLVLPFLQREQPDVFCVQELHEPDIAQFEKIVGPCVMYAPVCRHNPDGAGAEPLIMGSGIFSRLPVGSKEKWYYRGNEAHARDTVPRETMEDIALVVCELEHEKVSFRVMTTHFTWTPDGSASEQQRIDMHALLEILGTSPEFILCGDFNAPRGWETWNMLAEKYKDTIPARYKTSIDIDLHRLGKERGGEFEDKMVDGLFTTPGYVTRDVRLQFGVSDHAAIVATIEKVS